MLDYIEKQVEAIKKKRNISSEKEPEQEQTREVIEVMEEQLVILKQMQQTLEKIESTIDKVATEKSWSWKSFFTKK